MTSLYVFHLHFLDHCEIQAEMQRLRDKLAISEKTSKAEAQLKVKKTNEKCQEFHC